MLMFLLYLDLWRSDMKEAYKEKAEALLARIEALPEAEDIEWAADRLERMNWNPELLKDVNGLTRISKNALAEEVRSTLEMNEEETVRFFPGISMEPEKARLIQASLLVSAGELLWGLRADNPEAWDSINELYEDD